ncbi:DNA-binding protein [Salmonella enterica subsp. enterica serovar Muenchen]|nr:DNA-binding protein [Salmonella enterica subsp. enterica serovar Muenchen]EJM3644378.1 phage antirepressor KilAC domain-containing protein [Salmonella enterica]
MNNVINHKLSMTSVEIAELVGRRHDNVKRTIEKLVGNGVIRSPQIEVFEEINNLHLPVRRERFLFEGEQGKRDSIIVVAQLSPEFTARLVDRWQELEGKNQIPKSLPEALRLAADLEEQRQKLEQQLAIAAPKVEFAELVGQADGVSVGNFAKAVGLGQNHLFAWMRTNGILISGGSRHNVPKQEFMDRGYFTVKETAVNTNHGVQISFTSRITGRGQQWLTRRLFRAGLLSTTGGKA